MSEAVSSAGRRLLVVIRDDDGSAYAVPQMEMERYRMTPARRALVAARLRAQDPHGTSEVPIYEVDRATLAAYRLGREEWTRLEAMLHTAHSDSHGFEITERDPPWVAVAPRRGGARRTYVHTLPAWYWFSSVDDGGPKPRADLT